MSNAVWQAETLRVTSSHVREISKRRPSTKVEKFVKTSSILASEAIKQQPCIHRMRELLDLNILCITHVYQLH